ncbi:MAG: hypothetical protein H0X19_05955 [Rubrobacter sp.]|nr:hypothetical protein [Rubrobacter sp.]
MPLMVHDHLGYSRYRLPEPDPRWLLLRFAVPGTGVGLLARRVGVMTTNLASAEDFEGRSFVSVGREDGTLRIWR